eukprot:scaffold12045_cov63-Phaeocystis_antarctica.AAC.2
MFGRTEVSCGLRTACEPLGRETDRCPAMPITARHSQNLSSETRGMYSCLSPAQRLTLVALALTSTLRDHLHRVALRRRPLRVDDLSLQPQERPQHPAVLVVGYALELPPRIVEVGGRAQRVEEHALRQVGPVVEGALVAWAEDHGHTAAQDRVEVASARGGRARRLEAVFGGAVDILRSREAGDARCTDAAPFRDHTAQWIAVQIADERAELRAVGDTLLAAKLLHVRAQLLVACRAEPHTLGTLPAQVPCLGGRVRNGEAPVLRDGVLEAGAPVSPLACAIGRLHIEALDRHDVDVGPRVVPK